MSVVHDLSSARGIAAAWKDDAPYDHVALDDDSMSAPRLHAKYVEAMADARHKLIVLKKNLKAAEKLLRTYYLGGSTDEDLQELGGREQFQGKTLRSDLAGEVSRDVLYSDIDDLIQLQEARLDVLKEVLRQIDKRGFHVKGAIEWRKFQAGG